MIHGRRIVLGLFEIMGLYGLLFLVPFLIALIYEPWNFTLIANVAVPRNAVIFLLMALMGFAISGLRRFFPETDQRADLSDREGTLVVGLGWLMITAYSAIPFLMSGVMSHPGDAWFESMSGLTTTGASILNVQLEQLPQSVMIWRAMLNFVGGLGIIVLSAAILTRVTHGGQSLMAAESTGTSLTRIRPRLKETAQTLWIIYLGFSAALFVSLMLLFKFEVGMSWSQSFYDGLLHAFTTISTGGFSNQSSSIAAYDSWFLEAVLIVFMLLAATSFTLHHAWLSRNHRELFRDDEWRFFMGALVFVVAFLTLVVWDAGVAIGQAFRDVSFTVVSLVTSTGFATADYDAWPEVAKIFLILLMFTGASAGSTAGGIKMLRILILLRVVRREIQRLLHPRAVIPIRHNGKRVQEHTLLTITAFLFSFLTTWLIGAILLAALEPHLTFSDSAVAAASAIGNTGPALGALGPTDNYAGLSHASKFLLTFLMWMGRLEIFTPLLVLNIREWRK